LVTGSGMRTCYDMGTVSPHLLRQNSEKESLTTSLCGLRGGGLTEGNGRNKGGRRFGAWQHRRLLSQILGLSLGADRLLTIPFPLYQGLSYRGQHSSKGHGFAAGGPTRAVHPYHELPARKRRPHQQNLDILISTIVLDRNSQFCFITAWENHHLRRAEAACDIAKEFAEHRTSARSTSRVPSQSH
jgi:hypothetical protein